MVRFLLPCVLAGLTAVTNAIPTITAKGSKFFTSEGNQFYVKGIAYQLVPGDPLVSTQQCSLDASLMKTIGTNSIRVYHVDPSVNHDGCMKAFSDAGIYLWLDLDTFETQIYEGAPQWNSSQRDAYAKVLDAFHSYDNLAGVFVGNEAITTGNGSVTAPYVKAAARDLKAYRDSKKYRKIPIGYSAADIATLRPMLQNYLACGSNQSEALDFFSLNAYSWCGTSSYQQSGYSILEKNSTDLNIPIFMSETGCQKPKPRDFQDQTALFGDMADTWSGSIIYEWIQETNDYGLIQYGTPVAPDTPGGPPEGYFRSGTPTPIQPDFDNLSKVWKTLTPSGVKASAYTNLPTPVACPDFTSGAWEVYPTAPLPTLGQVHKFGPQTSPAPTSGGGPVPSGTSAAGSGTQAASPAQSKGAAPDNLNRELKGVGAALAGVFAFFIWL